jgi:RNA polymerase sigma-70 factor (ECF subfamily)
MTAWNRVARFRVSSASLSAPDDCTALITQRAEPEAHPSPVPGSLSTGGGEPSSVVRDALLLDDRTLLAQMCAGEESAFAALFERYYDKLHAFAEMYVASPDEAEEVVGDVFVRLWTLRERLGVHTSVKSYLYTATRNHALNQLRRERARRRWIGAANEAGEAPGMGGVHAVEDELYASELARAIDQAISLLPDRCRQVFLLHRQHGLTHAEIASTLELSPKTVENHVGRALKALRDRLRDYLHD